ncbi:hypothetical protein [Halalkalibacter krulwichiae]|uniref:Uncharacterized protein n=1 Tax=Halalkalibacter krulwichiae TaxID=199441 RepID=A0A1X9M7D7_9BACI|nr:hypothetical protein [Halalkalibacter krulwichiae]ARK28594.1 hypothetical protein BkAM31D_01215 [Halalkalibacter krulwichiae]
MEVELKSLKEEYAEQLFAFELENRRFFEQLVSSRGRIITVITILRKV